METVAIDGQNQVACGIVRELLLVQNNVARNVVGVGLGRIAPAISLIAFREPTGMGQEKDAFNFNHQDTLSSDTS
jgi:hypothetical protein